MFALREKLVMSGMTLLLLKRVVIDGNWRLRLQWNCLRRWVHNVLHLLMAALKRPLLPFWMNILKRE